MKPLRIAIIGGGISGLSAGFFLRKKFGEKISLTIYEKDDRLGGTIGTSRENGYLTDWGPNGFLDREPLTLEFIDQIGLKDRLLPSNHKSEKRFIYRNRRLWEISPHPAKFMASRLLSLSGRVRMAMEYFIPGRTDDSDESIYDFAVRRIGREAADTLIDPMVSGVFGGNAAELSLGACFPVMEKMEREYHGLIKAMLKKRRENGPGIAKKGPAGPSGHLTSFRGGCFTLVEQLEGILHHDILRRSEVRSIAHSDDRRFRIAGSAGTDDFDRVIIAVPSYTAGEILKEISSETADLLAQIPYSSLAVVCHGYRIADVGRDLDGFGFVVPHNQNLEILGSIWTSVIFPEQAPDGYVLFRTMLGGALNNDIINLAPARLAAISHDRLKLIMNIQDRPQYEKIIIWKNAIPQYTLGHRSRLERIEGNLIRIGHIYLAGNAYTGIGLNDAIKRSFNLVETIAAGIPDIS